MARLPADPAQRGRTPVTAARIIVWRHGRTEWNQTERFQGQADIELDSLGVRAGPAGGGGARDLPAGRASSPATSSRTMQTAGALAELTGLPISTDKRLREIHVGTWEGLTGDELRALEPEASAKLWAGEDVRRSATGESVAEVGERASSALAEIGAGAAGRVHRGRGDPRSGRAGRDQPAGRAIRTSCGGCSAAWTTAAGPASSGTGAGHTGASPATTSASRPRLDTIS